MEGNDPDDDDDVAEKPPPQQLVKPEEKHWVCHVPVSTQMVTGPKSTRCYPHR